MHWGKRGPGSPSGRRRGAFRPGSESLEDRCLLSTIDLTTTQTAPLGIEMIGKAANNKAGYTVTDVGNVTGSGFDSFVVSVPGLATATAGGTPAFGNAGSAAYLVFGSKAVNINNAFDYLGLANGKTNGVSSTLISGQRAGDLGVLGTLGTPPATGQLNPTVMQPTATGAAPVLGFNYDGLTFVTGLNAGTGLGRNSGLGFSVAALGDINGDGFDDFAIGAPNDAGGGKVFIIYGGTALTSLTTTAKTIDLEPTAGTNSTTTPTKVVTLSIPNAAAGTQVGYSVAGLGDYFNNSNVDHDIGIGVPGLNGDTGAAFAISGAFINGLATGTNVNLATVGTGNNALAGIQYTGVNLGDRTGASISSAGSFDGATASNNRPLDSLLIGAPGALLGGGVVYLVYSVQSFAANSQIGTTQSLSTLGNVPTTNPVTNPLQGVVFGDQTPGDQFGFSLSTAGQFTGASPDAIIVGAPGYNLGTGFADVIYGVKGTTTSTPTRLNGQFVISPTATSTTFVSTSLIGPAINNFTGYSVGVSSHIHVGTTAVTGTQPITDVLIGAPGFQSGQGTVYDIPGSIVGGTTLTGPQMLSNISATPLNGTQFVANGSADPAVTTGGLGSSVSARNPVVDPTSLLTTLDSDSVPDLFFGAPFSTLNNPSNPLTPLRILAGVVYAVEGGFIGSGSSGGGGGGGGGTTTGPIFQPIAATTLVPPVFTGDLAGLAFPPVSTLEHLNSYQPLPVQLAYEQFLPAPGFLAREEVYHKPGKGKNAHQFPAGTILNVAAIGHSENRYSKYNSLAHRVFTRGKLKHDQSITFTHKVKVIPRSEQTQAFSG